jgi:hypothetical protein
MARRSSRYLIAVPFTVGLRLHIEDIPMAGNRLPDSNPEGVGVQVVVDAQGKNIAGWVWSTLLSFDRADDGTPAEIVPAMLYLLNGRFKGKRYFGGRCSPYAALHSQN